MKTLVIKWTQWGTVVDEDGNETREHHEEVLPVAMSDVLTCTTKWDGLKIVLVDGRVIETSDTTELFFR